MKRMDVSKQFLTDASTAFDNKGYRSCASRAYYAVFHACVAMFEQYGYRSRNFIGRTGYPANRWEHGIIIKYFHIEFISKKGLFDWKVGVQIRRLYRTRIEADYRVELEIVKDLAEEILEIAGEIVAHIGRRF